MESINVATKNDIVFYNKENGDINIELLPNNTEFYNLDVIISV